MLLYQRGNLNVSIRSAEESPGRVRTAIDMYRDCGINGLIGVEDQAHMHLGELLDAYGDSMCFVGGIDGRALRGSFEDIKREVDCKASLARQGRVIPCLSTHVYPEVDYPKYEYYARCLEEALERS